MQDTDDFSKTNDQLRKEGIELIEYAGVNFTGADEANELIMVRLDDSSQLDFDDTYLGTKGYMTIGRPDGEVGYTYSGAGGGHVSLNHEQAMIIIRTHQDKITALL